MMKTGRPLCVLIPSLFTHLVLWLQSIVEDKTMSVSVKSLGIDRLGIEERLALVEELWDSIAADSAAIPLTDAQRAELDRRLADHEAT
ncbi:MAG: addiction module protein, partial [Gammaproteobacteria bacterium]